MTYLRTLRLHLILTSNTLLCTIMIVMSRLDLDHYALIIFLSLILHLFNQILKYLRLVINFLDTELSKLDLLEPFNSIFLMQFLSGKQIHLPLHCKGTNIIFTITTHIIDIHLSGSPWLPQNKTELFSYFFIIVFKVPVV